MQHTSRELVQYSFLQRNVIVATFVFLCLVFWSALFLFFLCFGRVCGCRFRGARTRGSSRLQSKTNIVRFFKGILYTSVSLQSQNCYWNLTVEPFPSQRWKKNRWISSAGSKISCTFQDSIIHSLGVERLISRLYLSHNNNCPPKCCNTFVFNFPCVSVVPREIEDNAYAKFEKANKEKECYGRCANGRYRLDFVKISRWDFGMCICVLYSIQCNRPSDQCKSKRLSTTSEFERFYKESRY